MFPGSEPDFARAPKHDYSLGTLRPTRSERGTLASRSESGRSEAYGSALALARALRTVNRLNTSTRHARRFGHA